jgi:hypothetical protein
MIGRELFLAQDIIVVQDAHCYQLFEWELTLLSGEVVSKIPGLALREIEG